MTYGDVALGVECALPAGFTVPARGGRVRKSLLWLVRFLLGRASAPPSPLATAKRS